MANNNLEAAESIEAGHGYDSALYSRFEEWRNAEGVSIKQAATMLNRPEAIIKNYLAVDFRGDDLKGFEEDVRNLLRLKDQKIFASHGEFLELSTSRAIWEVLQFCKSNGRMGACIGPAGSSKTMTARVFARKTPGTILLTADLARRSVSAIIYLLSGLQSCSSWGAHTSDLLERLIERLRYSHDLLIIDEAHFLDWQGFEIIRTIWDRTETGIVYLGAPTLYSEMKKRRGFQWDQILSRLAMRRNLDQISFSDVQILADSIYPGLKRDCLTFLLEKGLESGRFRTISMLLDQLKYVCESENLRPGLKLLKQIADY